jgi:hypothetical protein
LFILLNLTNLNILPSFPGLSCVKKGLPPIRKAPVMVRKTSMGNRRTIAIRDKIKSNILLKKFLYMPFLQKIIFCPVLNL